MGGGAGGGCHLFWEAGAGLACWKVPGAMGAPWGLLVKAVSEVRALYPLPRAQRSPPAERGARRAEPWHAGKNGGLLGTTSVLGNSRIAGSAFAPSRRPRSLHWGGRVASGSPPRGLRWQGRRGPHADGPPGPSPAPPRPRAQARPGVAPRAAETRAPAHPSGLGSSGPGRPDRGGDAGELRRGRRRPPAPPARDAAG